MMSQYRMAFQNIGGSNYPLDNSRMSSSVPNVQGITPSSSQVFIVQAPRLKRTYDSYEFNFAFLCSIVQVLCGLLSIALGISSPLECGELGFVGYGIWSGVMYFIGGMVEFMSVKRKTTFLITTTMVLSIINACLGVIQFSLGTYSANLDNIKYASNITTCPRVVATYPNKIDYQGAVVIDALLACTGIVEAVAAMFASITCCIAICGPQDYTSASDIPVRRNRVLPAQFVFTSNQPPMNLGNQTYITGTSRG